jgi:hypothetical protein
VKQNRVGRSEINFIFFFNFISNSTCSSEYISNSKKVMRIFIKFNKGFISCIHRASVHMQNCPYLCTGCKYKDVNYISGTNYFFFFLRGSIKFLGSGQKFRVGRVSGNTTFFLYSLGDFPENKNINQFLFFPQDFEIHWSVQMCQVGLIGKEIDVSAGIFISHGLTDIVSFEPCLIHMYLNKVNLRKYVETAYCAWWFHNFVVNLL